ncbi:tRNA (adenosine(37)-N6)-dimethylallyltransferase MiaA [Aquimarina sp. 2201CG14-23]|uniref:tRNA (adenosine(37)-N6)-dimethylallyltransferase MiaA n=1 Tax=Aquimarina mycalae TaxID=3040073 RepID=UPI0024782DC1|nr:tRNA (adenosine(37)-N6)-dimethylallyltransferase MiaA [Aquimarina sp. 2201CG14-23]MDH7448278.1 tRNA (adenosine(37)-N6)-dimethylallyltransferase MiaA [Aquimarina sp. 2201CG14-23]
MKNNLIVIIGPTAIGKTSLSITLAKHFNCEIVSADSRQFYKEMCIGTAVPDPEELQQAKHHYIQHTSIHNSYTVGDFEKDALRTIDELFKKNKYAILVGGSGLYIDAVTKGLDSFPDIKSTVREELQKKYKEQGLEVLQEQLKILDPVHYEKVDLQNTHRVMRALEVCISSGKPYSSFITKTAKKRPFNIIKVGITAEREIIYNRINQRVDLMIQEGLLEEVKRLYPNKLLNALNTVGYKEIFEFIDGNCELDVAISEIKKNTRRFAKRQLTWFKKDQEITWFDYQDNAEATIEYIKEKSL